MKRSLLIAALSLVLAASAAARAEPVPPMRELIVQSDTVVLAAPAGAGRFKTLRVLLGTILKEGDVLEIDDFVSYDLTAPIAEGASERKPVRVVEALLFLGPREEAAPVARFPLMPSGLRVVTADGAVYHPERRPDPAHYSLYPYRSAVAWDDLVHKAGADAVEIGHLRSVKASEDVGRRNRALLDWIERRRREFGGGLSLDDGDEPASGWGSLEQDVFAWVFESHVPEDCWAAVKLYAELNQGWTPDLKTPAFGTRAWRALLLGVVTDNALLAGHRARALELLSLPAPLWRLATPLGQPVAVEPLDEKEQTTLIDRVTPLLKDANARVRTAAARALLEISMPRSDSLKSLRTDRALSALAEAYRAEPGGLVRDAVAEALGIIAGPKRWQELTGNAHGVVAVLKEPGCRHGAEGECRLAALQAEEAVGEDATLVLERLDAREKVVETKEKSLHNTAPSTAHYPTARGDVFCEYFTFSMADCTPGIWRMTIKGVAGKDKAPWTSEPRLLHLAPAPKPDQPNFNPSAPRIVFDP